MAWISYSANPDVLDVKFDEKNNCIQIDAEGYNHPRIWLKQTSYRQEKEGLLFLYRLRFAVDEAIKFNLEREVKND